MIQPMLMVLILLIVYWAKKSLENFLIYDVANKTPNGTKPFRIVFNKVEEDIRKYSSKYLALFHSNEKYERIFDRVRYLIMLKSNISDFCSQK